MTEADLAELEKRAEEASVAYEQNTALRAFVAMVPGIGSSLDLVFASGGQRYRERVLKHINAMKEDMQERLEAVEESALDKEYLESEEFFDLVMRAFDATIKTRDEEKRRLYARILTESTIASKRESHSPEEYLDLIANLTPRELAVARTLYRDLPRARYENSDSREVNEAFRNWQDRVQAKVGIDQADLQLILGRLLAAGLITEDTALFPSSSGPKDYIPLYWVSLSFEKLMRFLERRGPALEA